MTQEDKKLLLKDLCARLPYGVKINVHGEEDVLLELGVSSEWINASYDVEDVKPYLFPLSSMTEEQRNDVSKILIDTQNKFPPYGAINSNGLDNLFICVTNQASAFINYYLEHHIDIYGFIEKGLAIDATGLNIY